MLDKKKQKKNIATPFVLDETTSNWKILIIFLIINFLIISGINYFYPLVSSSKQDLKKFYKFHNQKLAVMDDLYDLQYSLTEFKKKPDENAYPVVQKSIKLTNTLENLDNAENIAGHFYQEIEQIVAKIPSLKILHQQIDKLIRINNNLKQYNLANLDHINNNYGAIGNKNLIVIKELLLLGDKIELFLQNLKYNYWLSKNDVEKFQKTIEEISQEVEQLKSIIQNKSNVSIYNNNYPILVNLDELFNELNSTMPMLIDLSEANTALDKTESSINSMINRVKMKRLETNNIMDEKTIIIITLLFTSILLSVLIGTAKLSKKTKKAYNNYLIKKEIFLLSHHINSEKNIEANTVLETKLEAEENTENNTKNNINTELNTKVETVE